MQINLRNEMMETDTDQDISLDTQSPHTARQCWQFIFDRNIELYWTSWTGGLMWCISHPPLESNKDLIDWI